MKRYLLLIPCILLILFTGCDISIDDPVDPTPTPTPSPTEDKTYDVRFYDGETLVGEKLDVPEGSSFSHVNYDMTEDETYTYNFLGWDANNDGEIESFPYTINSDVNFQAIYIKTYKTYHYDIYNLGELIKSIDCHYGDLIDYPTIESKIVGDEVYFFSGWCYNNKPFDGYTYNNCCENLRIDAYYPTDQIIKYYYNGQMFAQRLDEGTTLNFQSSFGINPKDGYQIVWYTDSAYLNETSISSMPKGNISLYGIDERINRGIKVNNKEEVLSYFNNMIINRTNQIEFDLGFNIDDLNTFISYLKDSSLSIYNYEVSAVGERKYLKLDVNFSKIYGKTSTNIAYTQLNNIEYTPNVKTRTADFLPIDDNTNTIKVTHSDALFYYLEQGYKPIIDESNTELLNLYNKMRSILIDIINDKDSDYDKIRKIYEYLIMNVTYDKEVLTLSEQKSSGVEEYNSFYLEGVFNDKLAVCDGISKAFTCLCRMEGIESVRVTGIINSSSLNHAWNKVKLDGTWYIVDATSGGTIIDNNELLSYSYLLISEQNYNSYATQTSTDYTYSCNQDYDVYSSINGINHLINSEQDFQDYLHTFVDTVNTKTVKGKYSTDIKLNYTYNDLTETINNVIQAAAIPGISFSYAETLGSILLIYELK